MADSLLVLPFQDLLDELRYERVSIGVQQHLALGKLLARYDGCKRSQLRDAIAALLASNEDEVRRIAAVFERMYPERPEKLPPPPQPNGWRRTIVAGGVAAVAAFILVIAICFLEPSVGPLPPQPPASGSGFRPPTDGSPPAVPSACSVPPRTTAITTWHATGLVFAGVLAALSLGIDALRRGRRGVRIQERSHRRSLLAVLPGAREYRLATDGIIRRDERASYAHFTAALARAVHEPITTCEIDANRTVAASLRAFPRLRLVHHIRRRSRPVLILEDITADMAPWRAKVDALITALTRHGIAVVRRYHQRDLSRIATTRHGRRIALSIVLQRHPDAPVILIGCQACDLAPVASCHTRVWLHPIGDITLWPDALREPDLPIAVLPMTRRGLLEVSRALRDPRARPPDETAASVTGHDARLFVALLSLAPAVTYELAEVMRAELFPDAPEALILLAAPQLAAGSGNTRSMTALRQSLSHLDPGRVHERRARRLLLRLLEASEPARRTAAHLRWQRDRALQQIALGDLAGVRTLEQLAAGPLADDLSTQLDREAEIDSDSARARELATLRKIAREVIPARSRRLAFASPHVATFLLAFAVLAVGAWLGVRETTHELLQRRGLLLTASADTPDTLLWSPTVDTSLSGMRNGAATMYRDGDSIARDLPIASSRRVSTDGHVHCFQIELLDAGVQYTSNPFLFPKDGSPIPQIPRISDCPSDMVVVPGGTFEMGSPAGKGGQDEQPVHQVTLSAYCIDRTEVTVEAYAACIQAKVCTAAREPADHLLDRFCNGLRTNRQDHPVNCVDWNQAKTYCTWNGRRLPSEAEWEYAARGTDGRRYPWGNEKPSAKLLNACGSECADMAKREEMKGEWRAMYSTSDGWETTARVGSFPAGASRFGAVDMAGNVWEWTADEYGLYVGTEESAPLRVATDNKKVIRGGGWASHDVGEVRAALRYWYSPVSYSSYLGFRCAQAH